ncbi:dUTP diphosphatase [Aureimonas sp. AU40]|uniref:dUTP diphosphatase n=1 Tax=Aureimonas sp. AU40 TaxID=1637747 RepID=UPI0009E670A5
MIEDAIDDRLEDDGEFDASDPNQSVRFKKLHPDAVIPTYATPGAAGFDLYAVEDTIIEPGQRKLIRTGLAAAIPEGFEMQIRPRSGLALKNGITVVNSPGTIDSDYRGDIGVILLNTDLDYTPGAFSNGGSIHPGREFRVNKGDRIAQGVIAFVPQLPLVEVEELEETERGEGGFGSTGTS